MTAAEIFAQCDKYMYRLANQAARWFHEDAEDWAQTFRLDVIRYAHNYDPSRGAVTTWLTLRCRRLMALRRAAVTAAKRAAMPRETLDATDRKHDRVDEREVDPSDAAEAGELVERVRAAVKALRSRDRLLVEELFALNGRPGVRQSALAARLGVSKVRVQQLAVKALAKVGERLAGAVGEDVVGRERPRLVKR